MRTRTLISRAAPLGLASLCLTLAVSSMVCKKVDDPGSGDVTVTALEMPGLHGGLTYLLRAESKSPIQEELPLSWDCGDTGQFVPVGVALSELHRAWLIEAPVHAANSGPDPADQAFEDASAAMQAALDAYDALFAETPFWQCVEIPSCVDQHIAIQDAAKKAMKDLTAALDLIAARPVTPPEAVAQACKFRFADAQVVLQVAPVLYPDWQQVVTIDKDPCQGITPIECYRRRVDAWRKRICGEVDTQGNPVTPAPAVESLKQPYQDMCKALRNGWATFPDPQCTTLDAAGITIPLKDAGVPEGGDDGGRPSEVQFNYPSFLQGPCSYSTFFHEMAHVVQHGHDANVGLLAIAAQLGALRAQIDAIKAEIEMMLASPVDEATRQKLGMKLVAYFNLKGQYDALFAQLRKTVLGDHIAAECGAFLQEMEHIVELVDGPPISPTDEPYARTACAKVLIATFADEMDTILNKEYQGVPPSPAAAAVLCACVDGMRLTAQGLTAPLDTTTIWSCMKDKYDVEKHLTALKMQAGCP